VGFNGCEGGMLADRWVVVVWGGEYGRVGGGLVDRVGKANA